MEAAQPEHSLPRMMYELFRENCLGFFVDHVGEGTCVSGEHVFSANVRVVFFKSGFGCPGPHSSSYE